MLGSLYENWGHVVIEDYCDNGFEATCTDNGFCYCNSCGEELQKGSVDNFEGFTEEGKEDAIRELDHEDRDVSDVLYNMRIHEVRNLEQDIIHSHGLTMLKLVKYTVNMFLTQKC